MGIWSSPRFRGVNIPKNTLSCHQPVAKALASEIQIVSNMCFLLTTVLVFKEGHLMFNKEQHNFPTKSPPYLGAGVPSLHWIFHVFSSKKNWSLLHNSLPVTKSPEIHGGKMCGNHTSWIHLPLHSLCHWGEDMCALWGLLYWIFLRLHTSHDPRSYWIIYTSYHQFCIFPHDSYDMTLTL